MSIVTGSVQLPKDGKIIRVHPIRHKRSRALGAFLTPTAAARPTKPGQRSRRARTTKVGVAAGRVIPPGPAPLVAPWRRRAPARLSLKPAYGTPRQPHQLRVRQTFSR